MRDVSNRVYVSNRNIQGGKKDSFTPYVKEKINLHGNDHIQPIPKLEGHQKTNVPSVIVTNPITSIDISQEEKQIISSRQNVGKCVIPNVANISEQRAHELAAMPSNSNTA